MWRSVGCLLIAGVLSGCAGMQTGGAGTPSPGGGAPATGGGPTILTGPPSASPGCDVGNICRVYVTMERDSTGTEQIHVYPETLRTNTGVKDAHIVWIILNDDVNFSVDKTIQMKQGSDGTQWTDKYKTDSDNGDRPGAGFRPKNFHGRFPKNAHSGVYHYAITVQRGSDPPVTKDPTIVNSN